MASDRVSRHPRPRRIRVAIVLPENEAISGRRQGAIGRIVSETVHRLDANDTGIDVVVIGNARLNNRRIHGWPIRHYYWPALSNSVSWRVPSQIGWLVAKAIPKRVWSSFDVVEVHNRPSWLRHIRTRTKAKVALRQHNYLPNPIELGPDLPDIFMPVSRDIINQATIAILESSTYILPGGVDTSVFWSRPLKERSQNIIYVGRVTPEKGVRELILAIPIVAQETRDFTLQIVGSHWWDSKNLTDYENEVRCAATKVNNDLGFDAVVFHGQEPQSRVAELMRNARVAAFPSIWREPFGLVNIEALASGTPVISSFRGGAREALARGAIEVDPNNTQRFATELTNLLNDDVYWASLSSAGLEHVKKRFSWEVVTANWATCIRSVSQ